MNTLRRIELINSTYEFTDNLDCIEETINKVKSILGFKKVISISGGGTGIIVENDILQKKIGTDVF